MATILPSTLTEGMLIETSSVEDESEFNANTNTKTSSSLKKLKFKCPFENCGMAYRKNWLLEEHVRKHNKERPFICNLPDCSKSFTKEAHLRRHKVMVHEKICEQMCDVPGCGKVFNNKYSLKKHKNKLHNQNKNLFFCCECSKGFNKKWKLNQHMYIHTGEPPFKCTQCNIGFTLVRDFTKHKRNHKTYTCHCGQIFEKWALYQSHLTDHHKEIEVKCKNCEKLFSNKNNLQKHYKLCMKGDVQEFRCHYLNCTRTYHYRRNLNWHITNTHEKVETTRNEFKCSENGCEKVFYKKCFLNRHVKFSHSQGPKPKWPRSARKDKGKPKTYIAATLSGIKLTPTEHKELLKGNKELLANLCEQESTRNVIDQNLETSKENNCLKDCNDTEDCENNLKVNDTTLNKAHLNGNTTTEDRSYTSMDEHSYCKFVETTENNQHFIRDHEYATTLSENINSSDDILLGECSVVLNRIEECLA